MDLGLVFTLCILGAGFLITAFILLFTSSYKKRRCTESADAVVIDIKTSYSSDEGLSFYPVYEYYIDGVRYIGKGASIMNNTPQIDSVIPIMYDPAMPKRSYIAGRDNKIVTILGIIFTVIGFIPIVICICIALAS